jgi:hypothetical protein
MELVGVGDLEERELDENGNWKKRWNKVKMEEKIQESYAEFLHKLLPCRFSPHLQPLNTLQTDGIRLHRHFVNTRLPAPPKDPDARKKFMKDSEKPSTLKEFMSKNPRFKPRMIHATDLGERWTVGSACLDTHTGDVELLKVRRNYLDSCVKDYQHELEFRKELVGIDNLEEAMSELNKKSRSLDDFKDYTRAFLDPEVFPKIHGFYNSKTELKLAWKIKDKKTAHFSKIACEMFRMAGLPWHRPLTQKEKDSVLFVLGDSDFGGGRRKFSWHSAFARFFVRHCRGRGVAVVSIEEDFTSQKCPRCFGQLETLGIRIKFCPKCLKWLHRDLAAAQCMSLITYSHLLGYGRPGQFIHPPEDGKDPPDRKRPSGTESG